ncbi:MAG: WecB/TagA/CpsF family glycosyltransferase [Alphaproteobacteria bacterium]|nr:WecB/TagA/CpsF family glycosyltransferase [Alphaproteobacteria bacterium]
MNILGVGVSPIDLMEAVARIKGWISRNEPHYVCVRDVHGVVACQKDERLRRIHNQAGMVTPDGMPLVWISRRRGFKNVGRVCGPDLLPAVIGDVQDEGCRHFFYGGDTGVADKLVANLRMRFPGLKVVGTLSPPFRPLTDEEDREVIRQINDSGADIVWVGLSTPKQEFWMADHRKHLSAPVLIGIGAAFDFLAGVKPHAPRWVQRAGLEWSFRLLTEPGRLWRRYLTVIPSFLVLFMLQSLHLKKFPIDGGVKDPHAGNSPQ